MKNVAVPDSVHRMLKTSAATSGMKIKAIVEQALRDWLKNFRETAKETK